MTKMSTFILMFVLVVSMIFAGCTKTKAELVGSVKVENLDSDTRITLKYSQPISHIGNIV